MRIAVAFLALLTTSTLNAGELRIVTLAPHLTEWVYSLQEEDNLVGVSAYSDYPESALSKPIIADYQGVNIAALLHLKPDLVLAWEGGNKPQDIARIKSLGINVFLSRPQVPEDIVTELLELGTLLNKSHQAQKLVEPFSKTLNTLRLKYAKQQKIPIFYYSWHNPIMTIGKEAWGNQLLKVCGAETIFSDSPVDYPTVSAQQVLLKQPEIILSISDKPIEEVRQYWEKHHAFLNARYIRTNPDIMSRYTLRLAPELTRLCTSINNDEDKTH
ncbi:helical backbone metal receptor [Alteromonas sediminis]|uniref:helical backbone metal receptor n=1 Tax=Alteromonas sediminis TaxID=2259342 RepID=UPI001F0CBBA1|nr:helical backbone metal receptor [Alteromonas sediminis]